MGRHPSKESLKWPREIRRYGGYTSTTGKACARLRTRRRACDRPRPVVRPQVDEAAVIGRHQDRCVEARPALGFPPSAREQRGFHARAWDQARPKPDPRPASVIHDRCNRARRTAAAECGAASPERQAAAPRTTPPSGPRTWFDARLSRGAQNLVDEALAATSIADAPHQDLEFVVVAAHGGLRCFCMAGAEKSLEKSNFLSASGTADRPAPRGKPSRINGLAPRGGMPFILP